MKGGNGREPNIISACRHRQRVTGIGRQTNTRSHSRRHAAWRKGDKMSGREWGWGTRSVRVRE